MKRLIGLSIVLLFAALTTGCDAFRTLSDANINTSQGKPYELILVCPQAEWTGEVGDTLRAILTAPVPYINQTEPLFDVLRVTERGFRNMIAEHRNILKVLVDPSVKETTVAVQYDVTAQPQVVLTLQGPDDRSVVEYLSQHRAELVRVLEMAERDRDVAYNAKFGNPGVEEAIRKTFGIRMNVPRGYQLAASQPDFLWARYEYPTASQGFFLYSYPYAGPQSLTAAALTAARNQFAARIPGPSDGSYMTTSAAFEPDLRIFRLEDRTWFELRGFWDVEGDFMGGPFVSYSTVDQATGRILTLDCYVYSPKLHKRNFVRGVEHLLYGIEFPKPEQGK